MSTLVGKRDLGRIPAGHVDDLRSTRSKGLPEEQCSPVVGEIQDAQSTEPLHQSWHLLQLTARNVEPLQAGQAGDAWGEGPSTSLTPLGLLSGPQKVVLQIKRLQSAQCAQNLQQQLSVTMF